MTAPAAVRRDGSFARIPSQAQLERVVLDLLRRDAAALIRELATATTVTEWNAIVARHVAQFLTPASAVQRAWASRMLAPLVDAYLSGARAFTAELAVAVDLAAVRQAAETYAILRSRASATLILKTTAERVRTATAWNGEPDARPSETDVRAAFDAPARSKRAAAFEAAAAEASGEFGAAQEAGFTQIEWKYTNLSREPRDWHRNIDGVAMPLGVPFPTTQGCRFPRDPQAPLSETANCKCEAIYRRGDGR